MGFKETLSDYYHLFEDKYYSIMDFLADKGLPVYSFIDALEERGIPSFPVFLLFLTIILVFVISFAFFSPKTEPVYLSILDDSGNRLSNVKIIFKDQVTGKELELESSLFSDGKEVSLPLQKGAKVVLLASKDGYQSYSTDFVLGKENQVSIRLAKVEKKIEGKLRLVDSTTKDPVSSAKITIQFSDLSNAQCLERTLGNYSCLNVVEGKETKLKIEHQSYEQKNLSVKFLENSEIEIELVPKPTATIGKTSLIIKVFDDETKERIGGFKVRVFDAKDNKIISEIEKTENDIDFEEKISKGTSIRFLVEKQGYLPYDSSVNGKVYTLRDPEVIEQVYLRKGVNALSVIVLDPAGKPIKDAIVRLYNSKSEFLKESQTNIAGETTFENLDNKEPYYLTAWLERFMPAYKVVDLKVSNRETLVIERATAGNSGSVSVYTTDIQGKPLNDVSLNFFVEKEDKIIYPLGLPTQKTDLAGKYQFQAPLNSNVIIEASKGKLQGRANVKVLEAFQNEVVIQLREPFSLVKIKVLDEKGQEQKKGIVSVVSGNDVLFEGEYEEGGITIEPKGNDYVSVKFVPEEGETFEEEVFVKGLEEVSVKKGGQTSVGLVPTIEFLGLTNVDGSPAYGMIKGVDYFLKFRAVFQKDNKNNGIHVRLGEDDTGFIDSEDAGILGFSAVGASSFLGRSYFPKPEPGFEALDYENSGVEGSYSKWIELYFQNGGEKIIKVRVKAKETATKNEIAVKYRAWSTIADKTYRNPEDKELGLEKYSQNKTSLYAETKEEKIRILESTTTCNAEICASYKFIAQDGSEFMPENFTASIGSLYALEISVSQSNENLTIKADTQKQKPKIFFQGIGLNNDTDFIDMERQDTSIQLDNIPLQNSLKARVFFKAIEEGTTSIVLQLSTSKNTITKQFYFETYKEKTMVFRTNPETVSYGKDFSIILQDTENNPIEDAQIILSNKQGENITTIIGNKTFGKGMNGNYIIKNTFSQGEISYEVRAKNFKPKKGTITITKEGIIKFSEEKPYIIIQKGQKIGEKKISIINSTGFEIKDLTFEIVPIRNTEGLNISIQGPNSIGNYQTQDLLIVAEYLGVKESAHAEAKIIARGKISSNEVSVSAQTIAIIDYAPKIPVECLEFSKERIAMYIASGFEDRSYYDTRIAQTQQGKLQPNQFYENYLGPNTQGYPSSYYRYNMFTTSSSEKFTAKLAQKPQCQTQLILKPEITRENRLSEGIEITSTEIKLAPQQTTTGTRTDQQEVTITATNTIIRNFPTKEKFGFTITYKTDGFEKSIPIDIYIWNPRYALQMTTNIELFLAPNERGQYSAQIPLFVRNVGEADIENIEFRLAGATTQGNVELRVLPEYPIQILRKGEAIMPPKILVAQVMRNERTTLLEQKLLDVSGVINGQTFSFGPIIVNAHVSGAQCLIATPQSLDFYHSKAYEGSISRQIILKNTCAEEVRIIDITQPLAIGNNKVNLSPANFVILPGTEAQANIILEKRSPYNLSPQATFIRGFLPRSGKPIESTPIALDIKLGDIAEKSDAASEPIEVEICEEPEKKKIIRFPLIATSQNPKCDVTYCDATQMAQYLTEIIEQKISDAEKQISTYNSDISKTRACSSADIARGFCTFSGLGVKPEVITVFLSHDNMTPQLLTRTLEQSKGTAKSFQAKYMPEAEEGYYIGTGARQVLLNGSLRGCGKYTIRIDGEVAVQGSRIIPELMNIKLLFDKEEDKEERIITEQCTAKAQNIMNFLPRDEGLTKNSNYGAWTSITMPRDSSLEELSKEVAKNLFGSDQRYSQSETGFNTLKLDLTQEDGFIVKLKPEPINPNNPAIITALIKESLGKDDKLQQEITKEATQLIKEFRENQVSCISQDESYALLKTTKELGQIEATPKDTIKVQFGQATCTDLTIKSTTKEKVNLTARKGMAFDGIKGNPFFVPKDKEPNENNKITELSISKFDEKEHKFIETTKICVIGNSNLHQAQGKTILAGITRETTKSKKPKEVEIKLEVCGIHPLDFIEKAKDLEPKREPYYATFVWKGNENDKISINNLEKMSNLENNLKQAQEISEDKRKIKDTDSPEERKAKIWGNGAYLAACSTTSFTTSFLRPMIGLPGALINWAFDCVAPWAYNMFGDNEFFKNFSEIIDKALSTLRNFVKIPLGWASDVADVVLNWLGFKTKPPAGLTEGRITQEEFENAILEAMIPAQTIKSIVTKTTQTGIVDRLYLTEKLAEEISSEIATNTYGPLVKINSKGNEFKWNLKKLLIEEINEELIDIKWESTRIDFPKTFGLKQEVTEEQQIEAVKRALKKSISKQTGKGTTLIEEVYNSKNNITQNFSNAIGEEAIRKQTEEEVLKELTEKAKIFENQGKPTHLLGTTKLPNEINKLQQQEAQKITQLTEKNLRKVFGNSIPKELTNQIDAIKPNFTINQLPKNMIQVTFDLDEMAQRINTTIENYMKATSDRILKRVPWQKQVTKRTEEKVKEKISESIGKSHSAEEVIKGKVTKPTWSKFGLGTLKALRTLVKEGAFGALANFVGLKAYDIVYNSKIKALPTSAPQTQQLTIGTAIIGENTTTEIINYRTYRINIEQTGNSKTIKITGPTSIPEETKKEQIINDCQNPGIQKELYSLPGLIPNPDLPPTNFSSTNSKKRHAIIVKNYLEPQKASDRISVLIKKAIENQETTFNNETNLNLEALIISIGIAKTGLGITGYEYLFGCDITKRQTLGIYENAVCATNKVISYKDNCKSDVKCYYTNYNIDGNNKRISIEEVDTEKEFEQTYNKWKEYAWAS